ncbi:SDR family oxidoreductase [Massilia sp. CCM 8733]|uniref:SDR family oxidoreductase n=1 Tax=Massilia mucilaginosa TaxID=2609282 RepID=A0ABX0NLS5_9BURK|nr:SDR family oxidoreductase [Massilia mucilaginosa]NHZ87760.1 SDR family oxidoreductase [Massilia mucilaginosa]
MNHETDYPVTDSDTSAPPLRLAGKRCLVTGGSRNLGRAICLAFAAAGARVAFTYVKDDEQVEVTRGLLRELGAEPLVFKGSVTDAAHARSTVNAIVAEWEGLDILVNNAGVMQVLPIALLEEDDWDLVLDTCLKGAYIFSRAALRPMLRAKKGSILNIGSIAGERIVEAPVHYAAAKAGLQGFTRALAKEVGRYGIAVNDLSAGLLEAGMGQQAPQYRLDDYTTHCPLGRTATLEETAAFVTWLVSDENSFMSGARLTFDGGL